MKKERSLSYAFGMSTISTSPMLVHSLSDRHCCNSLCEGPAGPAKWRLFGQTSIGLSQERAWADLPLQTLTRAEFTATVASRGEADSGSVALSSHKRDRQQARTGQTLAQITAYKKYQNGRKGKDQTSVVKFAGKVPTVAPLLAVLEAFLPIHQSSRLLVRLMTSMTSPRLKEMSSGCCASKSNEAMT